MYVPSRRLFDVHEFGDYEVINEEEVEEARAAAPLITPDNRWESGAWARSGGRGYERGEAMQAWVWAQHGPDVGRGWGWEGHGGRTETCCSLEPTYVTGGSGSRSETRLGQGLSGQDQARPRDGSGVSRVELSRE